MDLDDSVRSALSELGYEASWLQYGFVDGALLREQLAELRSGDDPHSEHYRWRAFLRFIEGRGSLTDEQLGQYVELATLDPDDVMASSALVSLAAWAGLSAAQRATLRTLIVPGGPAAQRAFGRALLTGSQRGSGASEDRER
jgi:hypothetical protein